MCALCRGCCLTCRGILSVLIKKLKSGTNNGTVHEDRFTISRLVIFRTQDVSDRVLEEIKTHFL